MYMILWRSWLMTCDIKLINVLSVCSVYFDEVLTFGLCLVKSNVYFNEVLTFGLYPVKLSPDTLDCRHVSALKHVSESYRVQWKLSLDTSSSPFWELPRIIVEMVQTTNLHYLQIWFWNSDRTILSNPVNRKPFPEMVLLPATYINKSMIRMNRVEQPDFKNCKRFLRFRSEL